MLIQVVVDHSNSLSHETDVMLVVGNASKKAHRCVLEVRCPTIFAINVKVIFLFLLAQGICRGKLSRKD